MERLEIVSDFNTKMIRSDGIKLPMCNMKIYKDQMLVIRYDRNPYYTEHVITAEATTLTVKFVDSNYRKIRSSKDS